MASGWAPEGAVGDQIASSIEDAVRKAREQLPRGQSLAQCEQCDDAIPEGRQRALPGVRLCVSCQEQEDQSSATTSGYNRRASKDSQLR